MLFYAILSTLQEYEDSAAKQYSGNCVLKTKYEGNFLGESFFGDGYSIYSVVSEMRPKGLLKRVRKMPSRSKLNAKADAEALGYNADMPLSGPDPQTLDKLAEVLKTRVLSGQRTTKHVIHQNSAWPFWKAERWCAEKSGTLLLEYNDEVKLAAEASGGAPSSGKRHVGLRVDQRSNPNTMMVSPVLKQFF